MKIGFDLDNTVVDYSCSVQVYVKNLQNCDVNTVPELRNWFRVRNQDEEWTKVQSWLYTDGLRYAKVTEGFFDVLNTLAKHSFEFSILSHKTLFGPQRYGLRQFRKAMNEWLYGSELWKICANKVQYFDSLDAKVEGIRKGNFAYFIDDLRKVLEHEKFPNYTIPILYSTEKSTIENQSASNIILIEKFSSLTELIFLKK